MYRHLKARYIGPALVAVMVMIYGAYVSTRNTHRNLEDFAWVRHTRAVLLDLESLRTAAQNMVLCQRGYLITGDEQYLNAYGPSVEVMDQKLDALLALTHDNPSQQVRLGTIREVIRLKKIELQRVIDVRKSQGFDAASAIVREGRGRQLIARFSEMLDDMEQTELRLLKKRENTMVRSLNDTNVTVLAASVVAVVAGMTGTILLGLFLLGRERESSLEFEKEKAVQADQAKSEFLAMMSHEIRTPMNAILGFGELLHDSVQRPQDKHYAEAILTSSNSLLSLINDILDLSKIEAAKLDINFEAVDTSRFLESIETLFSFRALEKGLEFKVQKDASVPEYLMFDALRIRQILINLVGNALKFTREGSVQVKAWCLPADNEGMILNFEVVDTGIGIAQDKQQEIFRPFYQVESIYGRNYQGTGLGLSISDRLAKLMGGRISVSSELGKGSIFHAEFPVQRRTAKVEMPQAIPITHIDFNRLAPSKILVVDDVPLNRELIRGYLTSSHHDLIEAENGEQAVLMCRKFLPDLVLMDIRMPMVDGKTALTLLRENQATRHIPLIAVTASSLLNSQEELKSIFDGFASKPISRERLYQELSKFLAAYQPSVLVPDDQAPSPEELSAEPEVKNVGQLIGKLEQLKSIAWPGLMQLVPAQGTLNFARQLATLAANHECRSLAIYAKELEAAAKTMDFQQASRILSAFPAQIEQLNSFNV